MPWIETVEFDPIDRKYYNAVDMNRENNNIQFLKDKLTTLSFVINTPKPIRSDYTRKDFPTVTVINSIKANIKAIIAGFYPVPAPAIEINWARKQRFDYVEANKLEMNLSEIHKLITALEASFVYCGTFSCGEDGLL